MPNQPVSLTETSAAPQAPDIEDYVARQIRAARKALSLTQAEVAGRMGCTQTCLSYWESGSRSPGLRELADLALVVGQPLSFFLPPEQPGESRPEHIARRFHEVYEELAPVYGWQTQERSAVPWHDVPPENKGLMVETVTRLIHEGAFDA